MPANITGIARGSRTFRKISHSVIPIPRAASTVFSSTSSKPVILVFTAANHRGRDPRRWVVGAVVVCGVLWEMCEYFVHALADRLGIEPILVVYSKRDTVLDLGFDLVGALLVLVLGDHHLRNLLQPDN